MQSNKTQDKAVTRMLNVSFDDIPGELPKCRIPEDCDTAKLQGLVLQKLNNLHAEDLTEQAIWRDLLVFTRTYRTFYSRERVFTTLRKLIKENACSSISVNESSEPRATQSGWVDIDITFATQQDGLVGSGSGTVSVMLCPDGEWRIWMLRTWLECFEGHGHPDIPISVTNGASTVTSGTTNGTHKAEIETYGAVVVGGGQAGLSVAGRLHALGVKYLLLEKNQHIGDVWRKRYESLRWHTSKEYGNLPFGRTYAPEDEYMLPASRIGAGHQSWAEKHGLNVWTSTVVESSEYDEASEEWTISTTSERNVQRMIKAKNLVLCVGPGHATPIIPDWAVPDKVQQSGFKGTVIHSTSYRSSEPWSGKQGVVVGTANTGHDVAEDMVNSGMETTMLQRGSTFVFPAPWLHLAEDKDYHTEKLTATADRETFTYPNKIMREFTNKAVHKAIQANPHLFDDLEKAGFKVDRYGDIYENLYVRFGGHYVDIGCSGRIVRGEVKVKTSPVKRLTESGLLFEDGSELPADLIVLGTGFGHDFRIDASRIVGREIAEQMDDFWGVDAEGEIRGHARLAGHPHLYYHGGDIRMARWFSRFIALQVQADVLGKPMEAYRG